MEIDNTRLTDQCDIADLEIQRSLDRALETVKNSKRMESTGLCHDCGNSVDGGLLFCDKECRDEYEWYNGR